MLVFFTAKTQCLVLSLQQSIFSCLHLSSIFILFLLYFTSLSLLFPTSVFLPTYFSPWHCKIYILWQTNQGSPLSFPKPVWKTMALPSLSLRTFSWIFSKLTDKFQSSYPDVLVHRFNVKDFSEHQLIKNNCLTHLLIPSRTLNNRHVCRGRRPTYWWQETQQTASTSALITVKFSLSWYFFQVDLFDNRWSIIGSYQNITRWCLWKLHRVSYFKGYPTCVCGLPPVRIGVILPIFVLPLQHVAFPLDHFPQSSYIGGGGWLFIVLFTLMNHSEELNELLLYHV